MKSIIKSLLLAGVATFSINSVALAQLCPGVAATGPFSTQFALPLPANPGSTILINWDVVGGNIINRISANGADFLGQQSSTQMIVAGQDVSKTISTVVYGVIPTPGNPLVPLILQPFEIITNITLVNGLRAEFISVLGSGVSYSCLRADAGVLPNTTGPQVIVGPGFNIAAFNVSSFLPQSVINPIAVEYSLFFAVMESVGSVDDFFASMQATIASLTTEKNAALANVASCQSNMQVQVNSSAASQSQLVAVLRSSLRSAVQCVAKSRKGSEITKICKRIRNVIQKAVIN